MDLNERSFREWFIIVLAAIIAIEVGSTVVDSGMAELAILISVTGLIAWTLLAGDCWWIPMLVAVSMGGTLYFSFKVDMSQVGLGLVCLGLLPTLLLNRPHLYRPHRRPLSIFFYLLPLYLLIRFGIDMRGTPEGAGNIAKALFNAIWPFCFGWLFYQYGKSSLVGWVIGLIFILNTLRILGVCAGLYTHSIIVIPGINYLITIPADEGDFTEMRGVSYALLVVLLIVSQSVRSLLAKFFISFLLVPAAYVTLLGGSRAITGMVLLLPIVFFMAARRWVTLGAAAVVGMSVFIFVNANPQSLEQMPTQIERGLSGLIIKPKVIDMQANLAGSTQWHDDLRREGYRRWTESAKTLAFGSDLKAFRIEDYNNNAQVESDQIRVVAAADIGAYESGFWVTISTLGLTGYLLYALIFLRLLRDTVPYLVEHRVCSLKGGFIFWGTFTSIVWFAFGWTIGGYPSQEMALMIVASALVQDMKAEALQEKHVDVPTITSPSEPAFSLSG